eukprot:CAMPEP_0176429674 /NCGR_PEP_ID=MMETSP0127-20121128/13838_1 /TAXON_ID=938130 /ORGANISM="Platyophrya macrostoma, Strain WH" /LENGTH=401 /DNA_ID=CAMNT_0017811497 /DNA_START=36 /DNA_END=1241 /DNA_ORIENTATION=-
MFGKLKGGYEEVWKAIIRPPRDEYSLYDLGPKEFRLQGRNYKRTDFKIKNKRGLNLECSHFEPVKRVAPELPCVVYLHGNCSSRMEALPAVEILLPLNITLFCFDFAGCGLSEGEYISLGWYEKDDVETIINHLRATGTVSTIGLWGRSMGAVTALMHGDRDPSIAGIVLDSAFSDMKVLAEELAKSHSNLPKFIVSSAMSFVRKTIQSKAKFDINSLTPINHVKAGFIPAFFVTGKDDTFIQPHHTQDLYKKYAGDKNLVLVEGDHNSVRPQFLLDSIAIFFYNTLLCEYLPKEVEADDQEKKGPEDKKNANLAESYVKHNQKLQQNLNTGIGNEKQVADVIGDLDDEELRKAMEESMKELALLEDDENKVKSDPDLDKKRDLIENSQGQDAHEEAKVDK